MTNTFLWDGSNRSDTISIGENFTYEQPYWVELDLGGPFHERINRYQDVYAWVEKTFGAHTKGWNNPRWSASNRKYWFKNKKDRTLFVMRWS